ncbi:DUF1735 domain-containing protein [Niabella hibiscisoli]|uniref:DUF1735 domain-containing protein n=1 Tax=Niabella hibiscisoli TaxID=1825928 RepID=UPI001F0EC5E5|nr:DUF1735 domain-containing protein [Niabella hibiscisoli]MCH5718491.1 DUF1735 domain-containing protein [Niabella hibiscisoli]
MKFNIKNLGIGAVVAGTFLFSCNKPNEITLDTEGTLYMATAIDEKAKFNLFLADTAQTIAFGAAYSGLGFPDSDIPVSFTVQNDLIAAFNQANGTNYMSFPENAYSVSGLTTVIKAGKTTSVPLSISILSNKLDRDEKYILPIRLETPAGTKVSSNLQTTYFRLESIVRKETDITDLSKLTVSQEHRDGSGANEASPKLVDNNAASKFLLHTFPAGFWAQLTFVDAKVIGGYRLISGGDAPKETLRTGRFSDQMTERTGLH